MSTITRNLILLLFLSGIGNISLAQNILNLDNCRSLAIENNKSLAISKEKINVAKNERKAAYTAYLPNFNLTGSYILNQREISLLDSETKNAISGIGTNLGSSLTDVVKLLQQMQMNDLANLISSMGSAAVPALNKFGQTIVDKFRSDTRNMWAGTVTLTQPIYMGGKIHAYNKITKYAEEIAKEQYNTSLQEIILTTDQAYWQVVSLSNKKKLAESYLLLLQKLSADVEKMVSEGVATKADELTVRVKKNEAEMTLTKVDNGLSLSKMLLCQLCGLNLTDSITLYDESLENLAVPLANSNADVATAISSRPELKSLRLASDIYAQKVKTVRADFLPSASFIGNYLVSNPNLYNGFEKKFKGMWSLGVMVKVPLFHWGEGVYKVRAAKAEALISKLRLSETREKIELQVQQSSYKVDEAAKRLSMSLKNMEKAEENLRYANLGFKEGVIATSNLLEAQTAWLQAHSDKIDSQIDVKLTEVCLLKAVGTLSK